ncbi:MAG: hypothetical protein WD294_10535 [Phycisphaeraceae bacterium]
MLFVGTYDHTIDAKQRLAIPSEVRDRLDPEVDGEVLYAVVVEGPTLALYTERGFEKRAEQLDHSERSPEEILLYEQMFYSNAARVEIDKQGRIRLPERLIRVADLGRDVVLIGVKDHLQVHDRAAWQAKVEKLMADRPDLLMNPRRAMRAKD